jgi:hypothetical protein
MRAKEFIIEAIPLDQLRAMGSPESQDSKDLAARLRQSMSSKPRNFVSKNAKMGGAGAHKDKKKAEKQGDFKHKNKEYTESVEEGWKDKIAAAGLAGAMAFGAAGANAQSSGEDYLPDIVAHVTFKVNGKEISKDINLGTQYKSPKEASEALEKFLKSKGIKFYDFSLERVKPKGVEEGFMSFLKSEPAPKKKWDPAKDSRVASNYKNNDDAWIKLLLDKHRRGIPLTDREWNSIEQWKLKRLMRGESTEIQELSTDKLAQYKKAAGADAKKADADGDYARGDKRFKGINKATNKQFDNDLKKHGQQSVAERVRDPEDWDEGNTEPPNNFAVYINGKKWKVFKGRGRYADDNREQAHYQQLKDWAAKKSEASGKKWTVSITGEAATE